MSSRANPEVKRLCSQLLADSSSGHAQVRKIMPFKQRDANQDLVHTPLSLCANAMTS